MVYFPKTQSGYLDFLIKKHLCVEAEKAFQNLKKEIKNSVVKSIDELLAFERMHASNIAIAAILNQASRLIAFFSRTLRGSELMWPLAKKEACAISETTRHRKHITSHSF